MKLLLTSAGISTDALAGELVGLVGKPMEDILVLFVPTAAKLAPQDTSEDTEWRDDDVNEFRKRAFKQVDILDIAGLSEGEWRSHFEAADVLCFGGGNEQYLAKVMRETGVADALPELLKTKVYMGISAGSMVVGHFLSTEPRNIVYPEEIFDDIAPPFALVNCIFIPHLNSEFFTHVRKEVLDSLAPFPSPLYACDDHSAIKVIDEDITPVGDGVTLVWGQ